jgi:hypothetical protein
MGKEWVVRRILLAAGLALTLGALAMGGILGWPWT